MRWAVNKIENRFGYLNAFLLSTGRVYSLNILYTR